MIQPISPLREESNTRRILPILEFAAAHNSDRSHDEQVMKNALQIFDQLSPLHGLSEDERFLLQAASLLHDIGWSQGGSAHHKSGQRLVFRDRSLPLGKKERSMISLLVRYHRKALPSLKHRRFAELKEKNREKVMVLASILRIADGLDRSHQSLVENIIVTISPRKVIIHCSSRKDGYAEYDYGMQRSDLFSRVFNREVVIEWSVAC
ncbi:MAG: HD domain-containing protein [Methanocalculus sp.]|uniref:HD domain-containing protein n=1 Tax=Methanocalculus sp. TaxID=2004547 RepID=UPI00271F4308|nr:HD domain-containing protein [Methanocalculus sp.]MDO9540304.1 HD domain-containing protein [Methanocalculus sp.]